MTNPRRFAGAMAAIGLLGVVGFVGLYVLIKRVAPSVQDREQAAILREEAPPAHAAGVREEAGGTDAPPGAPVVAGSEAAPARAAAAAAISPAPAATAPVTPQAPVAAPVDPVVDLSLDEPTLEKFLEVRRRMYENYEPHEQKLYVLEEDLEEWRLRSKDIMRRAQIFLPINRARKEGLAATGLSTDEYERVRSVVYDHWWRATAAGVDIELKVSEARREMREIEEQLAAATRHQDEHRLNARKHAVSDRIGRLEWARSYKARQLLDRIPQSTRTICEKHAEAIDRYAMPAMDLIDF